MWVSYWAVHFEIFPKAWMYVCMYISVHVSTYTAVDLDKQASTLLASGCDSADLAAGVLPWSLLQAHSLDFKLLWTNTRLTNASVVIVRMSEGTETPAGKTILDWIFK